MTSDCLRALKGMQAMLCSGIAACWMASISSLYLPGMQADCQACRI